jgi:DNA-binding NarL/FixJ family response regulator
MVRLRAFSAVREPAGPPGPSGLPGPPADQVVGEQQDGSTGDGGKPGGQVEEPLQAVDVEQPGGDPAEAGLLAGAEVAAVEEAAGVISAAQAAEARAVLRAMTAEAAAAEAVTASDAIRAAAAADALQALIDADIVEEAAAHEAIEALRAAGVIIAAADQAAADAVADDAAVVTAADQAAAGAVAEDAATVSAASISMAEARVLRYLPTPLTFALIADKLGISRSAAKERAERAYKKLGVHGRAGLTRTEHQPRGLR